MKGKKKKGFLLAWLLVFSTFFFMIMGFIVTHYLYTSNSIFDSYKKLQASNYAVEGIELTRWYIMTEINKDKYSWWKNKILLLNWKYIVSYSNGYKLVPWDKIIIEQDYPYAIDYERSIEISDGDSSDEKNITARVSYKNELNLEENSFIEYTTTITNKYGE